MSDKVRQRRVVTGIYQYFVVWDGITGAYWNGIAFETPDVTGTNWRDNYINAMPETSTGSHIFEGTFPAAIPAGDDYIVMAFQGTAGLEDATDEPVSDPTKYPWDGTNEIELPVNLTQIKGIAQSATDLKDFADDGYDPITNKVQGVVLVDSVDSLTSTALTLIENAVWDAILTGASHNIATSAGKRLRTLASAVIYNENLPAQTGINNDNQVKFDTGASSTDGAYDPAIVAIVAGTGIGQTRIILEYDGSSRTATVDRNWKVNPAENDEFIIYADAGRQHVNEGLAQAGSINSITLNTLGSSSDDAYRNQYVFIRSGTGEDQVRRVTAYNGTTKVATISRNWDITPDNTSGYVMLPMACVEVQAVKDTELTVKAGSNFGVFYDNNNSDSVVVVNDIGSIKIQTDKLDTMIVEDSGGNQFTTIAVATAMKGITGITEGGTWDWEKVLKITTAWAAGNWILKPTDQNVQQLLDAENNSTVILEQELTLSPASGSEYKEVTVLI